MQCTYRIVQCSIFMFVSSNLESLLKQVREKLIQLGTQRGEMMEQWEGCWEYLQLSKCCQPHESKPKFISFYKLSKFLI